jgi:hypothetical protein
VVPELGVLVAANLAATVLRFRLRAWLFRPRPVGAEALGPAPG